VFGVKASLIAPFEPATDGRTRWRSPFDFVLVADADAPTADPPDRR
jgi:catechol 1,2-dioxygenase